jgi:hypothetical protein
MDNRFSELGDILKGKSSTNDVKVILDKLEQFKPAGTWNSKLWNLTDQGATLLTYVSFLQDAITILRPLLQG